MRLQTLVVGKDSEMEVREVEAAEMVTEEEAARMEDLSVGVVAYPHPFLLTLVSQEEAVMGSIPMAARRTYGSDCIGQTKTNQRRGVDNAIQPIGGGARGGGNDDNVQHDGNNEDYMMDDRQQ